MNKRYRSGLLPLYHKEMTDHVRGTRFLIVITLIWLTCFAGLYGALSGIEEVARSDGDFLFLKLYTTGGSSLPSFSTFIALLGPFVGLALGFDSINRERNNGTLNRLLAQPIHRDSVITGKFLAGVSIITMMVFTMGTLMGAVGMFRAAIIPSLEEVARVFTALLFTCFYIAFWLGLATLFSVICQHAATSALATISLWMFFTLFFGLLSRIIADAAFPVGGAYGELNLMKNYTLEMNLNRLSPYYLYGEAISTILNPSIRFINVVSVTQVYGTISGYLPFGQSLLLVWPHLTGLTALTIITFAISYIFFMRQEVRAS